MKVVTYITIQIQIMLIEGRNKPPQSLFTIARTWKQPKCPATDEWIKKMWHIYTMEYYSAIKRNKIELFVVRWMDLESVIQREVSQKRKTNTIC